MSGKIEKGAESLATMTRTCPARIAVALSLVILTGCAGGGAVAPLAEAPGPPATASEPSATYRSFRSAHSRGSRTSPGTGAIAGAESDVTTAALPPPAAVRPSIAPPHIVVPHHRAGPGITPKTITIGVPYDTTAMARMQAAYGVTMDRGAHGPWARIIAKELNAHGGIAGRRVKVEVLKLNRRENGQTLATYEQRECAHFTQVAEVFAVLPEVPHHDDARACYLSNGILSIASHHLDADEKIMSDYPNVFAVSAPTLDRWAPTYIAALDRQGFFDGAGGIGLVSYDEPAFVRAVARTFMPEMKRRGLKVDRLALLEHSKRNAGKLAAQSSAAVAEFERDGIDRVMFLEGGSPMASGFFLAAADAAKARFRYGFSTWNMPGAVFDGGVSFPEAQLRNTQGIGWSPVIDLRLPRARRMLTPRARHWLRVFADEGFGLGRCCAMSVALQLVERFLFLKAAIEGVDEGSINLETFRESATRLGSRFSPLVAMDSAFGPARRDGPAVYRDLGFSERCRCLVYRGPRRAFVRPG